LQDILISVRNDQIVLRSKTLNQQIIPRLSTAHNFANKTLPVYQFLCDLQAHKGQLGILFRWGILEFQCRFLPRVTCKNIIISAAQWNFYKKDIGAIIGKNGDELRIALAAFRQQWRVPVLVVLADGDNELFINFDDDRMVGIWLDAVRNRPGFVLKEFLPPGGSHAVRDREGRPYTSQLIAILQRSTAAYPATPSLTSASAASSAPPVSSASPAAPVSPPQAASTSPAGAGQQPVQRDFSAGSEWVYFKIYCGDRTADRILVQAIYPEVMRCLENRRIDRFFFLRYSDSGFHLRLRLHLTDLAHLGTVIHDLAERLKPFQTGGSISKVLLDTYQRETERYGSNSIDLAEEIFFHDSLAVLEMLAATEGMDRDELRWLWALRSIDEFFDGLAWTLMQRQSLAEYLKEAFHREFKVDKTLRSQLSGKYRQYRGRVQDILDRTKDAANGWQTALLPLNLRMEGLRPAIKRLWQMNAAGQLEIGMHELLYSYIHMMVNRVITSDPRLHELVLYDLLFAHYRSQTERSRNQQKKMTSAA
jgi:thiopeptide-type bacteriocin biosynthesis protein